MPKQPDTIREKVIQALAAQAARTPVVGVNVARGRAMFDPGEVPAVGLLPGVESAERSDYGSQDLVMPVELYASLAFGSENPSVVAERTLGDLVKTMLADRTLKGLAEDVAYSGGGVESYPEPGERHVTVVVTLLVTYSTRIGDPFAQ